MEIFGHAIALYGAIMRNGASHEQALELLRENAAKLSLTDAIRFAVKGDNIVRAGRGYSHFTDGCAMKLPFGEELKNFTDASLQTIMVTGEDYRNKFADQPTDFGAFFTLNSDMFAAENLDWGLSVLAHLQQDVNTDILWQEKICKVCDTENDKVVYRMTGREVDGKTFRDDMALANIFMHMIFVEYVNTNLKGHITEADFISTVASSFDRYYTEGMADNTKKYLVMDKRVFERDDAAATKLAKDVVATGMFRNQKQLLAISIKLFEDAMTSLNVLVNHFVRL